MLVVKKCGFMVLNVQYLLLKNGKGYTLHLQFL